MVQATVRVVTWSLLIRFLNSMLGLPVALKQGWTGWLAGWLAEGPGHLILIVIVLSPLQQNVFGVVLEAVGTGSVRAMQRIEM